MNFFSLFAFSVLAAETVISPVPDEVELLTVSAASPQVSFGQLTPATLPAAPAKVLGTTTNVMTKKKIYRIALLGDSMVDTLDPEAPHLKAALTKLYPEVTFQIFNYGVGAENIESGIRRLTNDYDYLGNHLPSLVSQKPDIVVVESFGYNPYIDSGGELDRHWLALANIVDTLKNSLPGVKIIIAATIAPNSCCFGDGAPGINFDAADKYQRVTRIKTYLDNAVRFAQSQKLPLADAFHPSLEDSGQGKLTYINPGDHIHYSDAGRELFAKVVTNTIVDYKLLE